MLESNGLTRVPNPAVELDSQTRSVDPGTESNHPSRRRARSRRRSTKQPTERIRTYTHSTTMALTLNFTVPAEDFATGRVFEAASRVELLDVVPASDRTPLFCVVDARNEDFTRVEDRLATAYPIEHATVFERAGSTRVYRLPCPSNDDALFGSIEDAGIVVDRAVGGDDWNIEAFASDREALRRLRHNCANRGVRVSVDRIHSSILVPERARDALTAPQRRTLQRALDDGYFETPRETTLSDLGEEFDITRQAVADRLRRGLKTLVAKSLSEEQFAVSNDNERAAQEPNRR